MQAKKQFSKSKAFQGQFEKQQQELSIFKKDMQVRARRHLHSMSQSMHTLLQPDTELDTVKELLKQSVEQVLKSAGEVLDLRNEILGSLDEYAAFLKQECLQERQARLEKQQKPRLPVKKYDVENAPMNMYTEKNAFIASVETTRMKYCCAIINKIGDRLQAQATPELFKLFDEELQQAKSKLSNTYDKVMHHLDMLQPFCILVGNAAQMLLEYSKAFLKQVGKLVGTFTMPQQYVMLVPYTIRLEILKRYQQFFTLFTFKQHGVNAALNADQMTSLYAIVQRIATYYLQFLLTNPLSSIHKPSMSKKNQNKHGLYWDVQDVILLLHDLFAFAPKAKFVYMINVLASLLKSQSLILDGKVEAPKKNGTSKMQTDDDDSSSDDDDENTASKILSKKVLHKNDIQVKSFAKSLFIKLAETSLEEARKQIEFETPFDYLNFVLVTFEYCKQTVHKMSNDQQESQAVQMPLQFIEQETSFLLGDQAEKNAQALNHELIHNRSKLEQLIAKYDEQEYAQIYN